MLRKIIFILLFISTASLAQFKDGDKNSATIRNGITNYSPSSFFLDFFNPNRFQMNHSVSMSYSSFGGQGLALSTYTNSMAYYFTDNLNIEVDASLVASPYSSLGTDHQNSINGIYLSRAQLNYSPIKNMNITVQYLNQPPGSFYYRGSNWGSPFGYSRFRPGF
ncbi:MAG: hypothetical protein ABFS12_08795 [Bacteroidota bacterium]